MPDARGVFESSSCTTILSKASLDYSSIEKTESAILGTVDVES